MDKEEKMALPGESASLKTPSLSNPVGRSRRTRQVTNTLPRPFMCKIRGCSKRFVSAANMRRHMDVFHAEKKLCPKCCSQLLRKPKITDVNTDSGEFLCQKFLYKCNNCRMSFAEFRLHRRQNPKKISILYPCDKCSGFFVALRDLNRHYRGHNVYECTETECAGLEFSGLGLKQHYSEHHKPDKMSCESCGKTFANKAVLREHVLSHMQLDKRQKYVCPFKDQGCTRTYLYKRNLVQHISYTHEHQGYPCSECQQVLSTKQKLKQHMDAHHKWKHSHAEEGRIVIARPTALHTFLGIREYAVVGGLGSRKFVPDEKEMVTKPIVKNKRGVRRQHKKETTKKTKRSNPTKNEFPQKTKNGNLETHAHPLPSTFISIVY